MKLFRVLYKLLKLFFYKIDIAYSWIATWFKFKLNGVLFCNDFVANGRSIINISLKGRCRLGRMLTINSGKHYNMIGGAQKSYFVVGPGAEMIIGDNVGISNSAIICYNKITIGNNVKIGGSTVIYDSDFHSLDPVKRSQNPEDPAFVKTEPVMIENNVFLGAHSIILKGVTIGENSIIGAGSLVSKSIPPNQIWAGNPAKFIKDI